MRKIVIYIFVFALFVACANESDEAKLQQLVVKSVTALQEGDVDTYLQTVTYGAELDSLHENLLRKMLTRYVENNTQKGGIELIEANTCTIENDSSARVGYVLTFKDGTRESHIAQLVRMVDGWKIIESL